MKKFWSLTELSWVNSQLSWLTRSDLFRKDQALKTLLIKSLPILTVVLIAAGLRFYRLRDLTTFGGDQGIDYQAVAAMIRDRRISLLGPVTHVGIYLGPLYYYLLIPFFRLFRFDPIAAPVMFALFGTATVGIFYILARKILDSNHKMREPGTVPESIAFLAALLYAVSPVILESSRAPSQPHLIPFFATLILISIIRIIERRAKHWDALVIGVSLASVIQFHFLAFPLFIFTALVLFVFRPLFSSLSFWSFFRWAAVPAAVLLFPWILFELRHNFFITSQVIAYFGTGEVSLQPLEHGIRVVRVIWFSFDKLIGQGHWWLTAITMIMAAIGVILRRNEKTIKLLAMYFAINVLGISLYFDPFSNHYISALYPAIILLSSLGIYHLLSTSLVFITFISVIIFIFLMNDFSRSHGYTMPPGVTTTTIQKTARRIADDHAINPGSFNFVNTLDGDTRGNPYRYVLAYVEKILPESPEHYSEADYLYIIARAGSWSELADQRWELTSFPVGETANLGIVNHNINLYRWKNGRLSGRDLRR